jgi:hypothetical protein
MTNPSFSKPSTKKTSWAQKLAASKAPVVKSLDKPFMEMPTGSRMLIASPELFDKILRELPKGTTVSIAEIRDTLAADHSADFTCPLSSGIFLRVAAEAAWESIQNGARPEDVTPFWRAIDPESTLARKLRCGPEFIREQRSVETSASA